jgi:hypothetical protein
MKVKNSNKILTKKNILVYYQPQQHFLESVWFGEYPELVTIQTRYRLDKQVPQELIRSVLVS